MGLFTPVIMSYLSKLSAYGKGRLLDVGCGTKPYLDVFAGVDNYVGMDRPSSVDLSRPNTVQRLEVMDVIGSADELPFTAESFDTVLATQLIEHLPDPDRFFKEAYRVLRPTGHLILTFPLVNPVHEKPYDFFRYTEYGAKCLCEKAGMNMVNVQAMGGGWLMIGYMMRHLLSSGSADCTKPLKRRILDILAQYSYLFCSWLDTKDPHEDSTLNYVVVARKR